MSATRRAAFKRLMRRSVVGLLLLTLTACMTVGQSFPVKNVKRIEMGKTTRADILELFGTPWRTGIEDGRKVWTYAQYKYGLSGQTLARDLTIRFDEQGTVVSYSFSSSVPGEAELQ